jgi:transposase InsO family protein
VPCGPELVRDIMRELHLRPCQPKPWRVSLTEADDRDHRLPDLLEQDFSAGRPGEKMVGDITYISTWEGWLFLATVIDCHTRMVVGYATADNYKTPLIDAALRHAHGRVEFAPDAVFHSDRGVRELHLMRVCRDYRATRPPAVGRPDHSRSVAALNHFGRAAVTAPPRWAGDPRRRKAGCGSQLGVSVWR